MRLLIHGGAPWSPSGYAVQTRLFAPRIQALGHDVAIACWHGLTGGNQVEDQTLSLPGPRGPIPLYPAGYTEYSFDLLPDYYADFEADACVTILDAWVCEPRVFQHGERWIPLYPVDCEPLAPAVKRVIEQVPTRYVISRFGEQVTKDAGLSSTYIPAAYHPAYQPDGDNLRDVAGWGDKYVVGVVAANKGAKGHPARKNWPNIFAGFAEFKQRVPDSLLYVHSLTGRQLQGLDLPAVAKSYGLGKEDVVWSRPLGAHLGYSSEVMASLYRSFDVFLNPAMGEGFGVPIVEAQACGVPAVTGDWTAMSEVTKTGVKIPKDQATPWAWHFEEATNQYVAPPTAIADALEEAHETSWPAKDEIQRRVLEYQADNVVAEYWKPALDALEKRPPTVGPNREQRRRAKISGGKAAAR